MWELPLRLLDDETNGVPMARAISILPPPEFERWRSPIGANPARQRRVLGHPLSPV